MLRNMEKENNNKKTHIKNRFVIFERRKILNLDEASANRSLCIIINEVC
jgi:hypothetical protein